MTARPRVAILGCGKMGAAMCRRLASLGHSVVVWNRTLARAEATAAAAAQEGRGRVLVVATPLEALEALEEQAAAAKSPSVALFMLADTAAVASVVGSMGVSGDKPWHAVARARGVTVCNITSGSPADGRTIGDLVSGPYVDGAYCGPPAKARGGAGQLFVSSDSGTEALTGCQDLLDALGDVTFCGRVGAARALDYAVVDLAFVNYVSYCANAAMLEKEGVDTALFAREASKRLQATPQALELASARMERRGAYDEDPTATLGTWRNFWASRLPYMRDCGFPTVFPDFAVRLLDDAGASGDHAGADVTRLQEVLRYKDTAP